MHQSFLIRLAKKGILYHSGAQKARSWRQYEGFPYPEAVRDRISKKGDYGQRMDDTR